jgi:NAD(P)-dependent dehydrogenase (short-subunit alcohol dehydrogenase family)
MKVDARVINTTSRSGLFGSPGQTNYGPAKAGIAGFTVIAAMELERYGVTVNAVAPTALTRRRPAGGARDGRDDRHGARRCVARYPLAGGCSARAVTGRVLAVFGGTISVLEGWVFGPEIHSDERWTPDRLDEVLTGLLAKAAPSVMCLRGSLE